MPQWDFLNFLRENGKQFPSLKVMMNAEATDLVWSGDTVAGVKADTPEGPVEIRADLTIGCDGRHSIVRERARLEVEEIGAPMDVLWFRAGRRADENESLFARVETGKMMVTFDRGDYWQCAYVIAKGQYDAVKARGLDAFRDDVVSMAPILKSGMSDVKTWDDVKLLTVAINRLKRWTRPGLLCIGDAAHAMSPVGGVGVNLAVQDAVATANLLAAKLASGCSVRRRTGCGAPAAGVSGADDAGDAGRGPEQHHQRRAQAGRPAAAGLRSLRAWSTRCRGCRASPRVFVALGVRPEHVHSPRLRSAYAHDRKAAVDGNGGAGDEVRRARRLRNTAMPAKSPIAPHRAAGVRASTLSCRPSICSRARLVRSVSIQPGSTALTWMLSAAQATAQERVNCTMPPLLAA